MATHKEVRNNATFAVVITSAFWALDELKNAAHSLSKSIWLRKPPQTGKQQAA